MKIIDDTKRALREVVRLLEDAHGPMVALEIMRSAELTLGTQANRLINALYDTPVADTVWVSPATSTGGSPCGGSL